jgi:hypothetical protein
MRGDDESVDVVVRSGRVALSLSSVILGPDFVVLAGTILDPEIQMLGGAPAPIETLVEMAIGGALASGAHIERETTWTLETEGEAQPVDWMVTPVELSEGFALQDARARVADLELRAFALEDLAATVGVCLAGGVGALAVWLQHKRAEKMGAEALKAAEREFEKCLAAGGMPRIRFGVSGEADTTLTPEARLRVKQGTRYEVDCRPAS